MAIKRSTVLSNRNTRNEEVSEFEGGWLNIGVNTNIDGVDTFIRLPLGVAVSDLAKRKRKITAKVKRDNPDFAARLTIENQMIDQICGAFNSMEEGDSLPTDMLDVQLFRAEPNTEDDPSTTSEASFDLFAKA